MPRIQWLGSGFGQRGSTSNCGASTPAAATAARFSRTVETIPSPARRARKAATRRNLCFTVFLHFPVRCGFAVMAYPPCFQNSLLLTERDCLLDRQTAWILHHLSFREWRKTIFSSSRAGRRHFVSTASPTSSRCLVRNKNKLVR